MARGWESKSVEAQQAEATDANSASKPRLTPKEAAQFREKENLRMARNRILRQLESASAPRYRALLEESLKELDIRLEHLPGAT
jgi:hypothetical protein